MTELYKTLKNYGKVKLNEPLSKHTTFKIGGPAEMLLIVEDTESLVKTLQLLDAEGVDHFILGGGSNMLVRDDGYSGVVIKIKSNEFSVDNTNFVFDAGYSTVAAANVTMKEGCTGFEWGVGVPGTIGGAVRGNAGAMGVEMKDSVKKVEVYQDGERIELSHDECDFQYRHSIFKDTQAIVLRVHLKLEKAENKDGMKKALEYLGYRSKTQPQGYPSTGCIFKNFEISSEFRFPNTEKQVPEEFLQKGKISAGWLIDQSGMKGAQVGQAKVSDTHGNFIINLGGATSSDVLSLIDEIKEKVYNTFGINIEEEIQII